MQVLVWIMFSFVVTNLMGFFTSISSPPQLAGGRVLGQLVIKREVRAGQIAVVMVDLSETDGNRKKDFCHLEHLKNFVGQIEG